MQLIFECPTGISGDMALGALIDLGAPAEELVAGLRTLGLPGWELRAERITSYGLTGTQLTITAAPEEHGRHLPEILGRIDASGLPEAVRRNARATFELLGQAEAQVHGVPVEQIHFHEVGAVDSILDIVGVALALHLLGVTAVYSGPLPLGSGWVDTAHGRLPVPAPATAALLATCGAPTRPDDGLRGELVTPTGAALLAALARFERPNVALRGVGYGFGRRDMGRPNAVRAWLAAPAPQQPATALLLECNLDDQPGEQLAYVAQRLLELGALDVWLTPIIMKKGRQAALLSALIPHDLEQAAAALIFRETTTLGLRRREVERHLCERTVEEVATPLGTVRVKRKRWMGEELGAAPEYEDCARIAAAAGVPLRQVYELALRCAAGV